MGVYVCAWLNGKHFICIIYIYICCTPKRLRTKPSMGWTLWCRKLKWTVWFGVGKGLWVMNNYAFSFQIKWLPNERQRRACLSLVASVGVVAGVVMNTMCILVQYYKNVEDVF